ncbi:MAG: OmpH family outer membrane protein [Saprospiraceae bacterium]
MKNTIKLLALLLFFAAATTTSFAQKYGHLNAGNLLEKLPEVAQADSQMEAYQKQMIAKGEDMAKKFQAKYTKFAQEAQQGLHSPVQQQDMEAELQKEQQAIVAYEQEVRQKVAAKREELLAPILNKVNDAIQAVGKEQGYSMIFDSSIPNVLLFVEDADDLTSAVKTKLGI